MDRSYELMNRCCFLSGLPFSHSSCTTPPTVCLVVSSKNEKKQMPDPARDRRRPNGSRSASRINTKTNVQFKKRYNDVGHNALWPVRCGKSRPHRSRDTLAEIERMWNRLAVEAEVSESLCSPASSKTRLSDLMRIAIMVMAYEMGLTQINASGDNAPTASLAQTIVMLAKQGSCENRTRRIFLVVTLPLPCFSTRTSCCASGRPAGPTIFHQLSTGGSAAGE